MAEDKLLAHLAADLFHIETAPFLLDDGVEHHLHQDVAQLFLHHDRVVSVDGFQRLACFFQKVFPDGSVGLDFVPRTAVLPVSQDADDLHEVFRRIVFTRRPVLHGASPFRIPKTSANRFKLYRRICRNARVQAHFPAFAAKFSFHSQQKAASPGGHRPAWAFSLTAVRRTCCRTARRPRRVRRTGGRSWPRCPRAFPRRALRHRQPSHRRPLPYSRKSSQ